MIILHFGPLWGHISTPRGPKRPFGGPRGPRRALEVLKRPQGHILVPTVTDWSNWVGNIHIMCSGPLRDIYGTPGAPRRARFGPTPSVSWPNFGSKKNWSEYRQVRCPGRRNGTPCSYSPITCHMEPSRWTKLPKT